MKNVKKIVILLFALGVMAGFTQAATHQSQPDAILLCAEAGSIVTVLLQNFPSTI